MRIFEIDNSRNKFVWIKHYFRTFYEEKIMDDMLQENEDGSISFIADKSYGGMASIASLSTKGTKTPKLEVKFHTINGNCMFNDMGLGSLVGSPKIVTNGFEASSNNLTSLEGGPEIVKGEYYVTNNKLFNWDHLPQECTRIGLDYHKDIPLLRFLKIRNLQSIYLAFGGAEDEIVNEVLKNNELNYQQKILELKRKLIANGLESNAKL